MKCPNCMTLLNQMQKDKAKVKELEKRIELAETIKEDALAYAKGYKARAEELDEELYKLTEKKIEG